MEMIASKSLKDATVVRLAANLDATQLFFGCFRVPIAPSRNLVIANITRCNYTGYADHQLTGTLLVNVTYGPNGTQIVAGGANTEQRFTVTGTSNIPQVAYGQFISDISGSGLWGTALFDLPIDVLANGQAWMVSNVLYTISDTFMN